MVDDIAASIARIRIAATVTAAAENQNRRYSYQCHSLIKINVSMVGMVSIV
ncbi:MAG: hypothetical protein WAM14_10795 [Candidatus Nitrosopolaris sp.]